MATGTNAAELDFDSVQRGNPEIERRAQEVINHCWAQGEATPSSPSTTWARAAVQRLPELTNDAGPWRALTCAPCRWKNPAWRPRKSGATRARSATCWPSRRNRWRVPGVLRARALPVCRGRRGHRERQLVLEDPRCAGGRPGTRGHAHGRAAGQAAQDAPRRPRQRASSPRST